LSSKIFFVLSSCLLLGIFETASYSFSHFLIGSILTQKIFLWKLIRVLNESYHFALSECWYKMSINSMTIKNSINLDVTIHNNKEAILILMVHMTFSTCKFNPILSKHVLIFLSKVVK
jgi:hypothetical protein